MKTTSRADRIVLTGASTGGPGLIEKIVKHLPDSLAGSLIVAQHMDPFPLYSFAKRLERLCSHPVVFARAKTPVNEGIVYLLGETLRLVENGENVHFDTPENRRGFYHPTIDILFESASELSTPAISAYLLSGIGSDGAKGLKRLKLAGHRTFAQDEATSVVYGMPKSAVELDAVQRVMSIDEIVGQIGATLA
ncbi:CheB methylesterase domain-containing protein [Hydrogenimonas sp.]